VSSIFASLLTSAGLGAGAGLNAYATMLVFGLLARLRPEDILAFAGALAAILLPLLVLVVLLLIVLFFVMLARRKAVPA
jgi:hypothetical protein